MPWILHPLLIVANERTIISEQYILFLDVYGGDSKQASSSPWLNNHVSSEWLGQYNKPPIPLSFEKVSMHAGHKVLMEVDNNSALKLLAAARISLNLLLIYNYYYINWLLNHI
jgi:hypothetical protein